MSFLWPVSLLLLATLPLLMIGYRRLYLRRRATLARFGSFGLVGGGSLPQPKPDVRRHVPPALFLIGLAVLIFSLARPVTLVSLPRIEGTVILAFDVSGSMAADDLKPTRIDAAKSIAQDFVQHQPATVEIGVVAFNDSGLNVQIPTRDQGAVLAAINRLKPESGSSIGSGILASLKLLITPADPANDHPYSNLTPTPAPSPTPMPAGSSTGTAIILFTDGENNEAPDPLATAQTAANLGVRIYTVGIGSTAGANLKIDGFSLHTQLDPQMLQQIAQITNGTYYTVNDESTLTDIYGSLTPQLVVKPEQTEVTAIGAGIGILIFLLGATFSLIWFRRPV